MAVKNTAQVVIDGKIITLGGYESEEYFQKVAAYMNNKISELSQMPGYSRQAMETKHTLLSLNITDDYFKAKKQAEIFEQDLQQKDQEMYDRSFRHLNRYRPIKNLMWTALPFSTETQIHLQQSLWQNLMGTVDM